jgi:uncharacterized protein (DUF433 family)
MSEAAAEQPQTTEACSIREHIVMTPGVCGGKPRIAGHRIRVQDIAVWHESRGLTPEEMVVHYPHISLADIHAALAYYFDHRAEIRQDIEAGRADAEALAAQTPSPLEEKLGKQGNGGGAAIPSR